MHQTEFISEYDQNSERIYRFLYYRTFNKELAEDLTSQTFMKAWEKIHTFDSSKGAFSTWLYRIARNTLIDHVRSHKETADLEHAADIGELPKFERDVDARATLQRVQKYLQSLPEDSRNIVLMRVWDEMSYSEIAEVLGKSEAACKMSFSRTIAKIQSEFGPIALLLLLSLSLK